MEYSNIHYPVSKMSGYSDTTYDYAFINTRTTIKLQDYFFIPVYNKLSKSPTYKHSRIIPQLEFKGLCQTNTVYTLPPIRPKQVYSFGNGRLSSLFHICKYEVKQKATVYSVCVPYSPFLLVFKIHQENKNTVTMNDQGRAYFYIIQSVFYLFSLCENVNIRTNSCFLTLKSWRLSLTIGVYDSCLIPYALEAMNPRLIPQLTKQLAMYQ